MSHPAQHDRHQSSQSTNRASLLWMFFLLWFPCQLVTRLVLLFLIIVHWKVWKYNLRFSVLYITVLYTFFVDTSIVAECPSFGRGALPALLYALPSGANPSLGRAFHKIDLWTHFMPFRAVLLPFFLGIFSKRCYLGKIYLSYTRVK